MVFCILNGINTYYNVVWLISRDEMLLKTGHLLQGDHVTNDEVMNSIRHAIGPYEDHITTVRKHKIEMVMGTKQDQQDLQR